MAGNWVKFERSVWANHVICADPVHFIIWWDLKTHAAYETHDAVFDGTPVRLEVGQLVTGANRIAERLRLSKSKVARVLDRFESAGLIVQTKSPRGRLITVVEDQQSTAAAPARRPQRAKDRKESVYRSDASYDLEAYARTAIGLREE
ncbi:MAG: MarR family transcriptional regulator [Clostridia bacterium]|nr:MarR family transcriptional regulator [Clostridia bacterium]MBR3552940.1 MarR family transcriptional regulator [Clostridia bacterium]